MVVTLRIATTRDQVVISELHLVSAMAQTIPVADQAVRKMKTIQETNILT